MTVSWLLLERYAMDDLAEPDRLRVEQALAKSPTARARLEMIRQDVRTPPPFPDLGADSGLPLPASPSIMRTRWWGVAGGLALAAAALLVVPSVRSGRGKGGELVLTVVSQSGQPVQNGSVVPVGTRIQARVTWDPGPAAARLEADGAVLWEGSVTGGNRERIPGAWAVQEGPVELCVVVGTSKDCVRIVGAAG